MDADTTAIRGLCHLMLFGSRDARKFAVEQIQFLVFDDEGPQNERSFRRYGQTSHPLYTTWMGMKQRCSNPRHKAYRYYGGRGIQICDRWLGEHGFANFLADMGERPEGHSIDRINNDGNYEPGNCRWATATIQGANKRSRQYRRSYTQA